MEMKIKHEQEKKMVLTMKVFLILATLSYCRGVSLREQVQHINRRKQESNFGLDALPQRRVLEYAIGGTILGVPTRVSHLPEAEPILPGHTLLRPEFGMLKSALKFPHKELEDGAGVYGNVAKLSIKYDGRNERVPYTSFRREAGDELGNDGFDSGSSDFDLHLKGLVSTYKDIVHTASKLLNKKANRRYSFNKTATGTDDLGYSFLRPQKLSQSQKLNSVESDVEYDIAQYSDDEGASTVKPDRYWDLQMSGDHMNLNPNAVEFSEFLPAELDESDEKQWMYLSETRPQPKPHKEPRNLYVVQLNTK